jgi:hypothetical protein
VCTWCTSAVTGYADSSASNADTHGGDVLMSSDVRRTAKMAQDNEFERELLILLPLLFSQL